MSHAREYRVIKILDREAPIAKSVQQYRVPVFYRLETGIDLPTTVGKRLLREAKAFRDTLPVIPAHPTSVQLTEDDFIMVQTVEFDLGGRNTLTPARFSVDNGPAYAGFTDGSTWNGWACPYFPKDVAEAIAEFQVSGGYAARYVPATDGFCFTFESGTECFGGVSKYTSPHRTPRRLYPIGLGSWCWDQIEEGDLSIGKGVG